MAGDAIEHGGKALRLADLFLDSRVYHHLLHRQLVDRYRCHARRQRLDLGLGLIFAAVSLIRGYALRRLFNRWRL